MVGVGTSYTRRTWSCGLALKPFGQLPSAWTNATWLRWLALSVFCPSQQLWKLDVRTSWLPSGHSTYLSVDCRSSKPVQLYEVLAFLRPLVNALASPVMMRMSFGIT